MSTVRVSSFSVKPKAYVECKQLDSASADSELKAWIAGVYATSSYSYLKELDVFITAFFKKDSQVVMAGDQSIRSLLRAYARIQTAFHYPISGEDLIWLYEKPVKREAFAKKIWQSHFKKLPDEAVWKAALAEIAVKKGEYNDILRKAFGSALDPRSQDYFLICFIEKLFMQPHQAVFTLADFFAIQAMDIMPVFLQEIIFGLLNQDSGAIHQAMEKVRRRLIKQFLLDVNRHGIQFEDAQGKVTHYYFKEGNSKLIRLFLQEKGLTEAEIEYIFATFHQAGWSSAMVGQLLREPFYVHLAILLKIVCNAQGQPERLIAQLDRLTRMGKRRIAVFSVDIALGEESKAVIKKNTTLQNLLPGLALQQHQKVAFHYQALTPEGFIDIPIQFTAEKTLLKAEEIRLRLAQITKEKKGLSVRIKKIKNKLYEWAAELRILRKPLLTLHPTLKQARANGWRRTLAGTLMITAIVGVCALTLGWGLLAMGVLTSAAIAYGIIAAGGTGLGGLMGYCFSRMVVKRAYLKLEMELKNKREKEITAIERPQRSQNDELLSCELYYKRLEQEEMALQTQPYLEEKTKNKPAMYSAIVSCQDESVIVTALNYDGVRVEFSRKQLKALVRYLSVDGSEEMEQDWGLVLEESLAMENNFRKIVGIAKASLEADDQKLSGAAIIDIVSVYGTKKQYNDLKELLASRREVYDICAVLEPIAQFGRHLL